MDAIQFLTQANATQGKAKQPEKMQKSENENSFLEIMRNAGKQEPPKAQETGKPKEKPDNPKAEVSAKTETLTEEVSVPDDFLAKLKKSLLQDGSQAAMQLLAQIMAMNPQQQAALVQQITTEQQTAMQQTAQPIEQPIAQIALPELQQVVSTVLSAQPAFTAPKTGEPHFTAEQPLAQVTEQPAQTVIQVAETTTSGEETLSGQSQFQNAVLQAKGMLEEKPADETATLDVDALQKKVDDGKNSTAAIPVAHVDKSGFVMNTQAPQNPQAVATQVVDGIKENLFSGKQEFVIQLKPEGLGEITVKLTMQGDKIALDLTAANRETQRMLNAEILTLKEALRPLNAEVHEVDSQPMQYFGMSQFRQDSSQQYHPQQQGNVYHLHDLQGEDDLMEVVPLQAMTNLLWLDRYA